VEPLLYHHVQHLLNQQLTLAQALLHHAYHLLNQQLTLA
jgi:hypothetical protein